MSRFPRGFQVGIPVAVLVTVLVSACGGGDFDDLERYTTEVKTRQKPRVEPLPEFAPFETYVYQAQDLRDPFTPPSFGADAEPARGPGTTAGLHPDFDRAREPLEFSPLDSLRMVGTLDRQGETWALVRATDGTIHRVQPGNYAGQNHGKITLITDNEVSLTEIVPDGIGGWMERQASLALSE